MFGVGRDLCGSSSPTLLPKQGHLQQAAQDLVQAGLDSSEGVSTISLGSLFQCSGTLRGKKVFLIFRRNFLCFKSQEKGLLTTKTEAFTEVLS